MKNTSNKIIPTLLLFLVFGASLYAQQGPPPGGPRGGRGGFDPGEMVKREKQNVYNAIEDLSDDQKLLLDGIYDEYIISFNELRDEARQTRNFQEMRPKMMALREEKDGLIKDVLSEEQFKIYQGIMENRRNQMRENVQRRRNRQDAAEDSTLSPGETPQDQSNPEN
jgi:hypothetical protein